MNDSDPVLICFDGSDDAKVAIGRAAALFAGRDAIVLSVWQRAHATPAFVMPAFTYAAELTAGDLAAIDETAGNVAAGLATEGADLAVEAGLRARPVTACAAGPVAETLLNVAGEYRVAAIVVGSRGRGGIKSALLGSVSNHIVHHTTRPTFVVRHDAPEPATGAPVAVLYDGSADAKRALEQAGTLLGGRAAVVVTAWQSAYAVPALGWGGAAYMPDYEALERAAEEAASASAQEGCERARAAGLTAEPRTERATGSVWPALLHAVEDMDAAAIVVGSRGLSGARSVLLGSVSAGVMHHTRRPVLVVRGDATSGAATVDPSQTATAS
jgi:nucleotide-binding universal stress UspA family protein